MRTRIVLISIGLFLVIGLGFSYLNEDRSGLPVSVEAQTAEPPLFRPVYGHFMGEYASYVFQTPADEKIFADDCIGCEHEVGNAVIFVELGCANKAESLFKSNSKNGVVESIPILDASGIAVGERRIRVFQDKSGKVGSARLFWQEGRDFWMVDAPTVALVKALFESEEYTNVRRKIEEEIKSYVPIQNANTIGRDRCKDTYQRRIRH